MKSFRKNATCNVIIDVVILLFLVIVACIGLTFSKSLPDEDGTISITAIKNPVLVSRDQLGVPTLRGTGRRDVAVALGFLHAQDRFFQMDLARRLASGELSVLFGTVTFPTDRAMRVHEFRNRSRQVLATMPSEQLRLLEAYCEGVNLGLNSLASRPFEYRILGASPEIWRPEDSILCMYAIALQLQDSTNSYEACLGAVLKQYGPAGLSFLAPTGSKWDAPLDGSMIPTPKIPPSSLLNFRNSAAMATNVSVRSDASDLETPGSNSFAMSGKHTKSGLPMIAGDMHLGLRIPNLWYRAELIWTKPNLRRLIGVTIPGLPQVVAGSNGDIAWAFTNAKIDTADLVVIERDRANPARYRVDESNRTIPFDRRRAIIQIKDAAPIEVAYCWTRWGPLIGRYQNHETFALRWSMHDIEAINFNLGKLESAQNTRDALDIAKTAGIPPLNVLVVDKHGHIGWTLSGKIPRRVQTDGRTPISWAQNQCGWNGYLSPDEHPEIVDPPSGRLWSANNRLVGGKFLEILGDGRLDLGARATQIRDDLVNVENARPHNLLAIMLDDRAVFLRHWQQFLLELLSGAPQEAKPKRELVKHLVETWDPRADRDSTGYYLVREWRAKVIQEALEPVDCACRKLYLGFTSSQFQLEDAVWAMTQERPAHLLNSKYSSWSELCLKALDDTADQYIQKCKVAGKFAWGDANIARIKHPLSRSIPLGLGVFLDMPPDRLSGDRDMPLVQNPSFGASERMVVTPSLESQGLYAMPGGQSAHPLSPFYRAGHSDWVNGYSEPLLPGQPEHFLNLIPKR